MSADPLQETLQLRMPRVLVSGVDYNDFRVVLSRVKQMSDWCPEWEKMGALHEALGQEALGLGRKATAGEAFRRAALCYHTGQAVFFDDAQEKNRVQLRAQAAYRQAMPHLRPPVQEMQIPFEGIVFPGNLRLPVDRSGKVPCVILNAGGDSTKEEFSSLEEEFLKRGMATISYDGPGQGPTWQLMKLRPDYEKPVAAVIDALAKRSEIDAARIGIWGRSFGGYSAPRSAAFEPRLKACISIGGFYDMAEIWDRFPNGAKVTLRYGFGAGSIAEAQEMSRAYTLKGILGRIKCPLLVVHSGLDEVCPVEVAERISKEAGGPTTLKIYPEGNHVCDNISYKARPFMADWMADKLGAR